MCGIAGLVGCSNRDRIERMTSILAHRGPDASGVKLFEPQAALGHRRLSILDLSERGRQPMACPESRFWITFNGEIYNYREVRQHLIQRGSTFHSDTDTEVVLHAWRQWGPGCLKHLNGMFAFAIWDAHTASLFAARDRLGIKPFYYHHQGDLLVFGSEIKAVLASGLVPKEVDYLALHTPEVYQVCPGTGFQAIHKLPPAHFLTFKNGQLLLERYWAIQPREEAPSLTRAADELDQLLDSAVKLQMVADVPVGAFLSGGLDSSVIVALMRRHTQQRISTFTIRFSEADQQFEQMSDDSVYASKVAQQFGCDHHEFTLEPKVVELLPKIVWHLDEPLSDPATINTYLISQAARSKGIIVLLNGMGGDEVFGGYRRQLACLLAKACRACLPDFIRHLMALAMARLPVASQRTANRLVRWTKRFQRLMAERKEDPYILNGAMSEELYRALFAWQETVPAEAHQHSYAQTIRQRLQRPKLGYVTRMCLADTEVYLPDHNLNYMDKCTMAASIEGRPPLTDHRVVDFLFSLHPRYRIHYSTQKFLLKQVGARYLPAEIVHRPKAPFGAPLRSWIRGELKTMVHDYLSTESLRRRGVYSPEFVARLIREDRDGREDNALLIWRLLCNELWFRTFFD